MSHSKRRDCGFTIAELGIALGMVVVIAVLTVPFGIIFYRDQILDETAQDILIALRRSQSQAITQREDSRFGINFSTETDAYVLFQGNSYITRMPAADEKFYLPFGFSLSGIGEVVFENLSGLPNTTGNITVSFLGNNKQININTQGKIERQ